MIANLITVARIVLVPVFIWILVAYPHPLDQHRWLAVLFFVLSAATDGVDGAVARKRGEVTNLGKILDPIADKLLIGGALVTLSALGQLQWWFTIVILVREIGITVYRFVVIRKRVVAASGGGKLKTVLQSILVGFLLAPHSGWVPWEILFPLIMVLMYVTLVVTIWTGVDYLIAAVKKNER